MQNVLVFVLVKFFFFFPQLIHCTSLHRDGTYPTIHWGEKKHPG